MDNFGISSPSLPHPTATLTLLLPAVGFGVRGVFLAEPISNFVGGLAAYITMWFLVYRKL